MDYIKSALEYTGLVAKPRQTSIGQALPHAVPATREEALENLMYVIRSTSHSDGWTEFSVHWL